ncbi:MULTISPECIES: thioredoxin-disulfide reductase [unclassified Amycolatopsis]|uniref:thioredoxin-disulfide reductase n=1 Tax=unclassified Amycolatopsis TaxID=2618356 RepID=UPI001C6A2021|nr:thioredoxin-disulfide reductase [Amycolatopsis sp. DSM 110486]QYN20208.1 thioredoxin-disulfide reductase [Amycolatopsis sp. DSM 110486]
MTGEPVRDLVIVGSGPAGYTAAIYAARAQLSPIVVEGYEHGGALMTTTDVENFPGFTEGVQGPDLMGRMREQARRFGADLVGERVEKVFLDGETKVVTTDRAEYRARAVILAMGASARMLGVPGEQSLVGRGVSTCATCDGYFFRDRDVAVVGGGDSAMEEAIFLTRFARSVTIVHRRTEFRASKAMLRRAEATPGITWLTGTEVEEIAGGEGVETVAVRDAATGQRSTLTVDGVFVAIGHDPRSSLVRDAVELDEAGYVKVSAPGTATNVPGVFAVGDLVDSTYRQAITAAGSGCAGAMDAERWLSEWAA